MEIIACVDENGGMSFNNRRQSRDKVLCGRILELTENGRLYMNEYSKNMFGDFPQIMADVNFLEKASADDFCFVENVDISPFMDKIGRIILYRWNRRYPYDLRFGIDLSDGWKRIGTIDFEGSSHEKITEEIYERI